MDTFVGLLVWGGLLWLVLALIGSGVRGGGGSRGNVRQPEALPGDVDPSLGPPLPAPSNRPPLFESPAEAEALADGLVIGHFLTRHHYEERIDALHEELEQRTQWDGEWWAHDGVDAVDAIEADGVDGLDDGVTFDEFALAGHSVEPWYDDMFDLEEDED